VGPREAALGVWREARAAEGRPPGTERLERVAEKLADPAGFLFVERQSGDVVGMALAEAFRAAGGRGDVRPGWGHVSMVFVHPEYQGRGVGGRLVGRMIREVPWRPRPGAGSGADPERTKPIRNREAPVSGPWLA